MDKENKKLYNDLQKKLLKCKYYEDTTYIPLHYLEDQKIKIKPQQSKLNVGLINIPCSVFGDILLIGMIMDISNWDELKTGDDAYDATFFKLDKDFISVSITSFATGIKFFFINVTKYLL